jgi:hypothetical protein
MARKTHVTRRKFLKLAGIGGAGLLSKKLFPHLPLLDAAYPISAHAQSDEIPDLEVSLRATLSDVQILDGNPTAVWMYQGEVVQGDPNALQTIPNSYLGPIFRVRKGQHIRIQFSNDLPEASVVHWHGLMLPEVMDGHPRFAIGTGETYTYDFRITNRAGTYWFHPHPHGSTAQQVYNGLAGLFIVHDDEEGALGLPDGDYDIPLVIQDRTFDEDNQLLYLTGGMMTQMMTEMMGFLGDNILVNGLADFEHSVETRAYRFRILNGSNFRILKLGWQDGAPLTVIGTDGGLLESPLQRPYVTLSPGERIELWVDFSDKAVGSQHQLNSLPFTGIEMGGTMMGGMDMPDTTTLPHGEEFPILRLNVDSAATETHTLPEHLSTIQGYQESDAVNHANPRKFELAMLNETWTINGRSFEMTAVADDEIVQANSLEVWEFINLVNPNNMGDMDGMDMDGMSGHNMGKSGKRRGIVTEDQMAHPMHIHGVQFQVLERIVDDAFRDGWETLRNGFVDEGWKDTVLVMPGERVKLLMRFGDDTGLFVYHCHNLEHEDLGFMRNYRVQA